MTERLDLTREELALLAEALDDAAFYRDTRSHVLRSAVRRTNRRSASVPTRPPIAADQEGAGTDVHLAKAQAYRALAGRLRQA